MLDFREHKRVHDALSDVLPWAALIAPEVVLNKDGSFLATIRYRGPDLDSSTEEERVVKVAHINNILKRLGSGWALHAEAQRRVVNSYPEPSFPDPLSYLIDLRRSEAFRSNQHYETRYFLSLIFMPPRERETKLAGKFINSSNEDGINYHRVLEGFRSRVKQTVDLLSRHFPEAQILTESELLTYLHSTISSKNHPIKMPPVPMYLDALLPDELLGKSIAFS